MTLLLCFFLFQKHENEEDGSSGNKDGERKEKKESNVAISFVFGQNIKDRAKVSFPSAGCEQVNSKQEFLCQAIVCVFGEIGFKKLKKFRCACEKKDLTSK